MTVHDVRTVTTANLPLQSPRRTTHPLDDAANLALARRLVVFTPNGEQIAALMARARQVLPMLTTDEIVQKIASHNPDCFWAIASRDRFDVSAPVGEGYVSALLLRRDGLRALLDGSLNRKDPPLSMICTQNEKPAGIYMWQVFAPGPLAAGVPLAMQKLWSPQYQDVDIFSWSVNESARRFVEGLGFRLAPKLAGSTAPQFHVFRRSPPLVYESLAPGMPGAVSKAPELSVRVARGMDDFMRAVAIRSAVYIGEQRCPYDEEFDGNDFSASHLIGYVGSEPAGCVRIRYFADFAKVERLVVRREFRKSGLAQHIVNASIKLCQMKGYGRIVAYAQKRLIQFWQQSGFTVPAEARELVFSDFDYVEMICNTEPAARAISSATDPYVVIRPEGDWHAPGILERSKERGVSSPTIQEVAA